MSAQGEALGEGLKACLQRREVPVPGGWVALFPPLVGLCPALLGLSPALLGLCPGGV